jgi:transmembrane sensor
MNDASDDTIMQEAVRRFTARQSGAWSARYEAQLQAWLAGDARRRAAFERLEALWGDAGELAGRVSYGTTASHAGRWRPMVALGAVIALAAALTLPAVHFWERWRAEEPRTLQTAGGVPEVYQLSDGSRVELDAGSALTVRMGAAQRELTLLRGEVTVSVARDSARPLVMRAGGGTITDLGTRFDVEALGAATRVAVFEGRVEILTARGRASLGPRQRGGYDAAGELEPVVAVAESTLGGSGNRRRFDNEPLGRVLERLRRYHTVAITLADPRLAQLPVSGTFRLNDLPLFLRTLEAALPVTVRWADPQHVLIDARADRPE